MGLHPNANINRIVRGRYLGQAWHTCGECFQQQLTGNDRGSREARARTDARRVCCDAIGGGVVVVQVAGKQW